MTAGVEVHQQRRHSHIALLTACCKGCGAQHVPIPKFSSALLRSNKYGELFVLLSTAKEALGRVFLQPPAKMDVATVELSTRRHRKLQEPGSDGTAVWRGGASHGERRAKKQKIAKGKRGRGDSKTKEVGLFSKSVQHGEGGALIECAGV